MSERRPKRKPRARPSKPSKWRKLAALNSNKLLGAVRQALLRDTDPNQLGEAAQTNRRFALDDIVNYVVKVQNICRKTITAHQQVSECWISPRWI